MAYWMNKQSLDKRGEPLTRESDYIGQYLQMPKAMLYLDRFNPNSGPSSRVALDALNRVAPFYDRGFTTYYVEDPKYQEKRH